MRVNALFCIGCGRMVPTKEQDGVRCLLCEMLLKSTKSQPLHQPTNAPHSVVAAFCAELRREIGVSEEEFNSLL